MVAASEAPTAPASPTAVRHSPAACSCAPVRTHSSSSDANVSGGKGGADSRCASLLRRRCKDRGGRQRAHGLRRRARVNGACGPPTAAVSACLTGTPPWGRAPPRPPAPRCCAASPGPRRPRAPRAAAPPARACDAPAGGRAGAHAGGGLGKCRVQDAACFSCLALALSLPRRAAQLSPRALLVARLVPDGGRQVARLDREARSQRPLPA